MLPSEFVRKHEIMLDDNELSLCKQAISMMVHTKDVHHDESHAYRLLDYLDEFIEAHEFKNYEKKVNLKILFIAILWHDVWKTERDPSNVVTLSWDVFMEGLAAARKFKRAAKTVNLNKDYIRKIKYIIRKHSLFQIIRRKNLEAKILADIDALDGVSLDRIYKIEKKYLCEKPATLTSLKLARFALKLFVQNKTADKFYFNWSKEKFLTMKNIFLRKAIIEIDEYEKLCKTCLENLEEYQKQLCFMQEKYINRAEEEKPEDPF